MVVTGVRTIIVPTTGQASAASWLCDRSQEFQNSNSRLEFSCRPSPAVIAGSIMTLPYVDGFFTTVRPIGFATPNRALLAGVCDYRPRADRHWISSDRPRRRQR